VPASTSELVHGTAIALAGRAALIRGDSGAGKSDLVLRCLATPVSPLIPHQAELVADDRVQIEAVGGALIARAPPQLRGLLEVRGLGILPIPFADSAELVLVVDLVAPDQVERLPDPWPRVDLLGRSLPRLALWPFEASAALKVLLALHRLNLSSESTS
jgi:HPr kinase/phosphorylase